LNNLRNRSITDLFGDLFSGNPVALCLCFGFILFVLAIAAAGVWFWWSRKSADDAFKKRVAEKRRKEDEEYMGSKKTKEI